MHATVRDRVVGCGRLIGDPMYAYIQDLIVDDANRGLGIGSALLGALLDFARVESGPDAFLGLMAAVGTQAFYERHGFAARPVDGPGMQLQRS